MIGVGKSSDLRCFHKVLNHYGYVELQEGKKKKDRNVMKIIAYTHLN